MRNIYRPFVFCFLLSSTFAQGPAIQWQKSLGGSNIDNGFAAVQTTDGGFISTGFSSSANGDVTGNHGQEDYWVIKQDASGAVQWKKCLGGTVSDYAQKIKQTLDGGYIVAGWTLSNDGDITFSRGHEDIWVVKLDTGGAIAWQKTYGGSLRDIAYSIKQTADKGYIICGATTSSDGEVTGQHGGYDVWVLKIDTLGNLQWQKTLGGSLNEFAYDVIQTYDDGYITGGATFSGDGDVSANQGQCDYWIVKLDTAGNMQWQKSYGGAGTDVVHAILQAADSGYVVAGSGYSMNGDQAGNHGSGDYWILKLDMAGVIQWQESFGGSGADECFGAAKTSDGGFVFSGYAISSNGDVTNNHGLNDCWVVKTNATGTLQWQQSYGGTANDFGSSIEETADGGFIISGSSYSNDGDATSNQGNSDIWLVKLSGNTTPVAASQNKEQITVYPNPATNFITIKCSCSLRVNEYKITDVCGRTIISTKLTNANELIDIGDLSAGVYMLQFPEDAKQSFKIIKQ